MTANRDPRYLEALLARAGRVRSLARALCADPSAAEDLAQDALVAALERGPAHAAAPSAWIARVLANLSTDRRRSEAARRERERRTSRAEAQPSASDLVERAETQRKLVECVLALPEPYRETLLERWFEERGPDEIARRAGIPASTVRTRLARGQAMLRERLERAEGRSWLAVLAPLALEPRSASLAAPATLSGGVLVSTGVKVSIGAAALAAATFLAWPKAAEEPRAAPVAAEAPPPALEPPPRAEPGPGERSAALAPSPAPAPIATEEPSGEPSEAECARMEERISADTLDGIVLRGRDPVERGTAYLRRGERLAPADPGRPWLGVPSTSWNPGEDELRTARIGRDGKFRFANLPPDLFTLAIDVGEGTCRQMFVQMFSPGRERRTIVIVLGTAAIAGHVYDEAGRPIRGARVAATLEVVRNRQPRAFTTVAWTGGDGAYELPELQSGTYRIGMRREGLESDGAFDPAFDETLEATLAIGERRVVDFGRPQRRPVWAGVVRARTGEPARGGGTIRLEAASDGRTLQTAYADTGEFRVALEPGRYAARVPAVGDPTTLVELGAVEVPEGGLRRDLTLPGTRLRGIAMDAGTGAPFAVDIEESISIRPHDQDYPGAITDARVGPGGEFVVDGLPPGRWIVRAWPRALHGVADQAVEVTILPGEIEVPLTVTIGR